jgi:hypothetical protein
MKTKLLIIIGVLALAGCESRYRYACQDPEKFETIHCTKDCRGDGTCPADVYGDHLND